MADRPDRFNFIDKHNQLIAFEGGNYYPSSAEDNSLNPSYPTHRTMTEHSITTPFKSSSDPDRQFSAGIAQSSVSGNKPSGNSISFEVASPIFGERQNISAHWENLNDVENGRIQSSSFSPYSSYEVKKEKMQSSSSEQSSSPIQFYKKEKKIEMIEISSDEPKIEKKIKKEEEKKPEGERINLQVRPVDQIPERRQFWHEIYIRNNERTMYGSMVQHTTIKIIYDNACALRLKNNWLWVRFAQRENVEFFQDVLSGLTQRAYDIYTLDQLKLTYDQLKNLNVPSRFRPNQTGFKGEIKLTVYMTLTKKKDDRFDGVYKKHNEMNLTPQINIFLEKFSQETWSIKRVEWINNQHENKGNPPLISLEPKLTALECLYFLQAAVMFGVQYPKGIDCAE